MSAVKSDLFAPSDQDDHEKMTQFGRNLNIKKAVRCPALGKFLDQKNFAVFPVSRHISCSKDFAVSLFPDTFRNQGILMFCLSKHLKGRSVPRVSHVFAHA